MPRGRLVTGGGRSVCASRFLNSRVAFWVLNRPLRGVVEVPVCLGTTTAPSAAVGRGRAQPSCLVPAFARDEGRSGGPRIVLPCCSWKLPWGLETAPGAPAAPALLKGAGAAGGGGGGVLLSPGEGPSFAPPEPLAGAGRALGCSARGSRFCGVNWRQGKARPAAGQPLCLLVGTGSGKSALLPEPVVRRQSGASASEAPSAAGAGFSAGCVLCAWGLDGAGGCRGDCAASQQPLGNPVVEWMGRGGGGGSCPESLCAAGQSLIPWAGGPGRILWARENLWPAQVLPASREEMGSL